MKTILTITSIFLFVFSISVSSLAQKTVKEGSVIYELTDINSDDPQAQMMKGTRMNIYFSKKNQMMEMSMMGGMVEIVTITDLKSQESKMLSNIMGNKTLVQMSKEETDKQKEKNKKPEYEVSFDKKDKKEIVGYKCYKAMLKGKDGSSMTAYVTDEIKTDSRFFQEMFPGLGVFPLEYTVDNMGVSVVFSAQEFNTKLASDTFDVSTDGYTEMSLEEFEKQMGGMGGLGF